MNRELGYEVIEEDNSNKSKWTSTLIEGTSKEIMTKYKFVTVQENKTILVYDRGVYISGGEILIERECERILEYSLTNRLLSEIKGHIMRNTYHSVREFDSDTNIINMSHGLYHISENKLLDHTFNYLSANQIKVTYSANLNQSCSASFRAKCCIIRR